MVNLFNFIIVMTRSFPLLKKFIDMLLRSSCNSNYFCVYAAFCTELRHHIFRANRFHGKYASIPMCSNRVGQVISTHFLHKWTKLGVGVQLNGWLLSTIDLCYIIMVNLFNFFIVKTWSFNLVKKLSTILITFLETTNNFKSISIALTHWTQAKTRQKQLVRLFFHVPMPCLWENWENEVSMLNDL